MHSSEHCWPFEEVISASVEDWLLPSGILCIGTEKRI